MAEKYQLCQILYANWSQINFCLKCFAECPFWSIFSEGRTAYLWFFRHEKKASKFIKIIFNNFCKEKKSRPRNKKFFFGLFGFFLLWSMEKSSKSFEKMAWRSFGRENKFTRLTNFQCCFSNCRFLNKTPFTFPILKSFKEQNTQFIISTHIYLLLIHPPSQ